MLKLGIMLKLGASEGATLSDGGALGIDDGAALLDGTALGRWDG